MLPFIKIGVAVAVITGSSWLAGKNPRLAGWIIALPLSSMLALLFSHAEYRDQAKSVAFAKSILTGVPLSLTFFLPFLFAEKLQLGFAATYASGVALLSASYFIQRSIWP